MPQIPTPTVQVTARSGRTSGPFLDQNISPDVFGAGVARAARDVGGALQNVGAVAFEQHEKKRKERVANAVAQSDFTPHEIATRKEVGPDAAGYRDNVLAKYDEFIETEANKIDDDATRMEYRRQMMLQRNEISSRSALYEEKIATVHSEAQANTSLTMLENKLMVDPTMYETYVRQGNDVIASRPNLTQAQIMSMQTQWRANSARARFNGMLEAATSVDDINNIEAELTGQTEGGPDWTKEFAPDDYLRMRGTIDTTRKAFITLADTQARAALDNLEARNTGLTLIPKEELAAVASVVKQSENPITQAKFARIARDQELIRTYQGANPAQVRADTLAGGGKATYPGMPAPVATAINQAAGTFDVSASYLGATVQKEYGGLLKGDATDYTVKAGTSSATGVMQFTEGTFLDVMKDGVTPTRIGISIAGKSDAEILELRKDPQIAIMAGAALAEKNKRQLSAALGRPVDDAEMYMAHFLGVGGASVLILAAQNDPTASAAGLLPEAARANYNVFYHEKGDKPKTVQEVYNGIARSFVTGPSQVAFGDDQARERIVKEMETAVDTDPMSFAASQGKFSVVPLDDPASYVARGASARAVADHYSVPMEDFKPLTIDEAATLSKRMESGTADDVLAVMADVQRMGGSVARAAFAQLGQKDQVYAYAAGLAYEAGDPVAAGEVVRGRKRLEENPAIKDTIGQPSDVSNMFAKVAGSALFEISPEQRQAAQEAAFAHYVETYTARGNAGLDETAFTASVSAVLGGNVAVVNGQQTVLPPGVDGEALNQALDRMTVADWTRLSPQKLPPRYTTGEIADPADLAREAVLRSVGGGQYKVMLDDGTFAITGRFIGGRYEAYLFAPEPDAIKEIARQAVPTDPIVSGPLGEELARQRSVANEGFWP